MTIYLRIIKDGKSVGKIILSHCTYHWVDIRGEWGFYIPSEQGFLDEIGYIALFEGTIHGIGDELEIWI